MLKKLFYRSCALVSELEDTLHHLHRWHRTWSTPPRDRVLDMYALEDRVLFSIAPIMNAAAVQAAAGTGTATVQDPQVSAMPAPDQSLIAANQVHAGQEPKQESQLSDNLNNNSITTFLSHTQDQKDASNADAPGKDRHVNFALVDDSLTNLDQLMRALDPNTEVYLYDHRQESPTDVLNTVYDWAKTNHAEIDSISILSHGVSGSFVLGNRWLSSSNLGEFAEAWKHLGEVMAPGGNIDVFGCNVAAGASGQDLIDNIGRLSDAAVFASVDNTGRGGNWVLEAASTTGNASTWRNPLDTAVLQQWNGLLTAYVVINTNDSGAGSLRQAILDANANPGADMITFSIAGTGVHTITLSSALPNITDTVNIDGYTQSGASANTLATGDNAVLQIELNGVATVDASGLTLDAGSSGSAIRGLVINNFDQTGINVLSNSNIIAGNFIGTNAGGDAALSNGFGIYITGQSNTIGGTTLAARNIISGNITEGVYIHSANSTPLSAVQRMARAMSSRGIPTVAFTWIRASAAM
jgi:hypothetical protein